MEPIDVHSSEPIDTNELAAEKIQAKRDQGLWYAVAGVGMLFAGSISTALSIGGMLMVLYGIFHYTRYSMQLARLRDDPWKDPELDAWEEEHYGEGREPEGAEVTTSDPDSAWGGKLH